jgi:hypothetical protein
MSGDPDSDMGKVRHGHRDPAAKYADGRGRNGRRCARRTPPWRERNHSFAA